MFVIFYLFSLCTWHAVCDKAACIMHASRVRSVVSAIFEIHMASRKEITDFFPKLLILSFVITDFVFWRLASLYVV